MRLDDATAYGNRSIRRRGPRILPSSWLSASFVSLATVALPMVVMVLAGCGGSKATLQQHEPTLAEQLAGAGRSVSEDVRGLIVTLPDILFDFDQAVVRPEVHETLAQLAAVLVQHPDLEMRIEGHTDSVGDEGYNQRLSERRARAVLEAFVELGLDADRMTAIGLGEANPVAENETEDGRARNRRVELVLPEGSSDQPLP